MWLCSEQWLCNGSSSTISNIVPFQSLAVRSPYNFPNPFTPAAPFANFKIHTPLRKPNWSFDLGPFSHHVGSVVSGRLSAVFALALPL